MTESEKLRKIFIGGLNWETSEEGLKDYFSEWGTIVDCVIMKKDGKSRGFGFVTYASSKSVDDCLKVRKHILDDREIEPKRSIPKDEAKNPMALTKTRKIFVGGLASTTTEDDIREYFTGLCEKDGDGQVIDIDLKRDKENQNRIRGFAFVTFDNDEIAEKVCAMKFHEIRMKQCEVKKAEPQSMIRKKHEDDDRGSYSSDRERSRERDRDSRDRGDRDRGDRDRSSRDRERSRDGDMSYFNPFGFNPAAFSAGGFAPGFGFGGMGFGGFPAGFGYGGFPAGFGMGGAGFGGFGPGGVSSERGSSGSSYDKGGYGGVGYRSSSDREGQSSKSQSNGASSSSRGSGSYDQAGMSSGYGYSPFAGMGGAVPSGDWSNFPAAAMMGMYGYNTNTPMSAGSESASKAYSGSGTSTDASFPMGSYAQMSSGFGPVARTDSTARGLSPSDTKSRSYRPY
ncbi:heterogeneous nuclear ribonucleoprotein A1-like 2 isoform X2 [Actinia tenebrosa]|uniref:Heterogeneous nuclear ribonucleoprotein A1-like 2 isoform X2 n=1 Tax=Actinia tenebrosa TaxID=6105 RepID=A0A6P8IP18_ACTTE|nr:heterogeneous nuclear ribonucleoprotein A1-like 2 isoform X2 [Actinia tenebrosa]